MNVNDVLAQFGDEVLRTFPAFREIVEGPGEMGDKMLRLNAILREHPEFGDQLAALAHTSLAPLRADAGMSTREIVIPDPSGRGRPRLNPIVEASIMERLQYDGDVPELRSGPMSPGQVPAVPVDTDARNPVAVGVMLGQASSEVHQEIRALEGAREQEVGRLLTDTSMSESEGGTSLYVQVTGMLDRANVPDPVGYERGALPALRDMGDCAEAGLLATLESVQEHALTWQALATTQGRRSLTPGVAGLVVEKMRVMGYGVTLHPVGERVPSGIQVLASHEWTFDMSGANSTNPSFAFADTAGHVLAHHIMHQLSRCEAGGSYTVAVRTVDTIPDRRVGWSATAWSSKESG